MDKGRGTDTEIVGRGDRFVFVDAPARYALVTLEPHGGSCFPPADGTGDAPQLGDDTRVYLESMPERKLVPCNSCTG